MGELSNESREILDMLIPIFEDLKGTPEHMKRERQKLLAMIQSADLRSPTLFVTLSPADLFWPELFQAIDPSLSVNDISKLSQTDRQKMLSANPVKAAIFFQTRFRGFFKHILNGSQKPLGKITDFWWRVEFQGRGSPHIHMLLWIQDAPS